MSRPNDEGPSGRENLALTIEPRGRFARIRQGGTSGLALLAFGAVFYVVARASRILDPFPCLWNDLYGNAAQACREASREGHRDSWAPYVIGLFALYVVGSIAYLGFDLARDKDWKSVALVALWIAALGYIVWAT